MRSILIALLLVAAPVAAGFAYPNATVTVTCSNQYSKASTTTSYYGKKSKTQVTIKQHVKGQEVCKT